MGSVDNIRWSSFIAERLIKLIGWILKSFSSSLEIIITGRSTGINLSTANDQHELRRNELCWATRGTANDFLSLPRSHSHLLSDKISRIFIARGWFLLERSCRSGVLCFPIDSRGFASPVIDGAFPNCCTHFIFKQNLHKILLLPRGIAASDRYEILRNEFREESLKLWV